MLRAAPLSRKRGRVGTATGGGGAGADGRRGGGSLSFDGPHLWPYTLRSGLDLELWQPAGIGAIARVGAAQRPVARLPGEVAVEAAETGCRGHVDRGVAQRTHARIRVEAAERGIRGVQVCRRRGAARDDVVALLATRQRRRCEDRVAERALRVTGRAPGDPDAAALREDRVAEDVDRLRHVVVRLDVHRIATVVDQQVRIERDVAFALEQRLGGVLVEEVAVDLVAIVAAVAADGEMPDQQVGPGHAAGGAVARLGENVVADHRALRRRRHAGHCGAVDLVLDLDVVADRFADQVALDQAGDERARAVRVAEVHAGAGADDRIAADRPVPGGRTHRGDSDDLLVAADAADHQVLQRDVMRRTLCGDARAAEVATVDLQVAHDDIARVVQPHRVVRGAAHQYRPRPAFGSGDHDGLRRAAVQVEQRQPRHVGQVVVGARGQHQRIAGHQRAHPRQVVARVGLYYAVGARVCVRGRARHGSDDRRARSAGGAAAGAGRTRAGRTRAGIHSRDRCGRRERRRGGFGGLAAACATGRERGRGQQGAAGQPGGAVREMGQRKHARHDAEQ